MPNSHLLTSKHLTVELMMNKNFKSLHQDDSLRKVVEYYQEYRITTLPVVDSEDNLVGVFPRKRLFRALLEGATLEEKVKNYMVDRPVFVTTDRTYDEYSLVVRVTKSRVDSVVVLNQQGKVAGMIGTAEYLRASLDVILSASVMLESLFTVNYEGIVITDASGRILRMNPVAEAMVGQSQSKMIGQTLKDMVPDLEISNEKVLGQRKTIGQLPVIVNQLPIVENDKIIGRSFAFLDISDMEKMARELEMVKNLQNTVSGVLNAASDGVFVSDTEGTIKYVNERACQLVSQECDKIIGTNIKNMFQNEKFHQIIESGIPEVDSYDIYGKQFIVSHVPFKNTGEDEEEITGMVSTAYLNDNMITEEIARKWLYLNQQLQYYKDELEKRAGGVSRFDQMVSYNPVFQEIKKEARFIARSTSTVLLTGESGVGKDMFARGLHEASSRAKGPFIKVNCVSIPESLFESELFGYAPGSFTGALKSGKSGYFERANNGTIFLDEIGDMPLSIQVKLLQVLQEKEFTRVGGTEKQQVDVRIIAATNRDLREAISNKTFREDLFYRLNVIEFHLPPLRNRPEDVIPLAQAFVEKYNDILGSRVTGIQESAQMALQQYDWPGNIRELENAIERAANYVWEGEIGIDNLPSQIRKGPVSTQERMPSYQGAMMDAERTLLLKTLEKTGGNKSAAARLLNMSRSTFYEKLAKYDIK
ncbi:MAG: PAS domain-containing protein [Alphaproteobacteria bacterium]|nr:PAS domain-containing protein [Alphaproteobacteria bacterium]